MIRLHPLAVLLVATAVAAQDPPAPPGGFPILEQLNQAITYADGYQTRYDLRLPDPGQVTPPPGGWPCLLLVHGFSGARGAFTLSGEGPGFARRGYITVAYDVRGQGQARTLNPTRGTTVTGRLEKADMAEIFAQLEARLGGQMDSGRLCVMGTSQGGDHSWAAAAWSEQQLPQPRGAITHFPKIAAVVPRAATPNFPELWNPDGNAFAGNFTRVWFNTNAILDPTMQAQLRQLFLNQDFAGLTAFLQNDPWRQDATLILSSAVPVLYQGAYDDFASAQSKALDALAAMPATTPTFAYMTTGYHKSPTNQLELAEQNALAERWLDLHVKGFADDLAGQPRFRLAEVPADSAVATDPTSIWQLRQTAAFPATGLTADTVLYLRQGGALSAQPPAAAEPTDRIRHVVPPTFTPSAWVATNNDTAAVFAAVPLSSVVYRGAPLAQDLEILGRPTARIHLQSPAPNLQVHVALLDEDPSGQQRYIAGGFRCRRGRTPGSEVVDVELRDLCYVLPRGHRIAVAVENHTWHRPIGISELRTVPYLESYEFFCQHDPASPSALHLPTRAPGLSARADSVSLSLQGGALGLPIAGGAGRAGSTYAMLASFAGAAPGFSFLGTAVPLNLDGLTTLGLLAPATPPFAGFVGSLDAAGAGAAGFTVAPGLLPASAFGLRLTFAAVSFDGGGLSAAAPSQVRIDG